MPVYTLGFLSLIFSESLSNSSRMLLTYESSDIFLQTFGNLTVEHKQQNREQKTVNWLIWLIKMQTIPLRLFRRAS